MAQQPVRTKFKPVSLFDGRALLYQGDCAKILPRLDEKSAVVITDAPYEDQTHKAKNGKSKRRIRTDRGPDLRAINFNSITGQRDRVIGPLIRVCAKWMLIFCSPEGIAAWRDAIENGGARYKRACFWCKPDAAPQFNGQGPGYAVEPFVTAWCGRGVSRWNGGGRRNFWMVPTNGRDRQGMHETEKPIALMMDLIRAFTNEGDIIIDPFMGSGTTGVAALALSRKFIGIEADPRFFKLSQGRIKSVFSGDMESKAIIAKLVGADDPGPLFGGLSA